MRSVNHTLRLAAHLIVHRGLHTGDQFATPDGPLDICAAIYLAAEVPYDLPERMTVPSEFYTDEVASLRLIESSATVMAAIQAISHTLGDACETQIEPGTYVPDYIEHVSNWAATPVGGGAGLLPLPALVVAAEERGLAFFPGALLDPRQERGRGVAVLLGPLGVFLLQLVDAPAVVLASEPVGQALLLARLESAVVGGRLVGHGRSSSSIRWCSSRCAPHTVPNSSSWHGPGPW
ncbi:hypothetical protein IQ62_01455 [Streptomyces scabiei]|nr:hypothetical protein IQ62_01455 [Streptomyces scabiei]